MHLHKYPLLGFVGRSGSGKTTLIEKLIPGLQRYGLRLAVIKHTHHTVDLDQPGKDSFRFRQAGVAQVMLASHSRSVLLHEHEKNTEEPDLSELLQHFKRNSFDLLLVEGFKHEPIDKIVVHRQANNKPILTDLEQQIALISDETVANITIPRFDINDVTSILQFIIQWYEQQTRTP
ncbi:MAG: molybdopterin-guanine dinucleotide biosynthesis protein B [Gammaproteobacteria bacterium]|nr:molybdopterin-guanine dinucleotide biosynthesis protein B [Gammaproteobacteria bacterium]MDH5729414.1 molybdopterin-guanine dinucleotide biosynthesis protein B [Gammaproteobacteria bacterium]